jgi:hypothetical protein
MQRLHLALLFLLIATAGCGHPTYGRKPVPALASDTLNGQPRKPGPANSPSTGTHDDPQVPSQERPKDAK